MYILKHLSHKYNDAFVPPYFWHSDKDECALGINDCNPETSICVNTLGSYVCYCKEGFQLSADGRTCEGRSEWSPEVHVCASFKEAIDMPNLFIKQFLCSLSAVHFDQSATLYAT